MLSSKRKPEQKQQRVAVGPGNANCMSIRYMSLRRGTCAVWLAAALLLLLLPPPLRCIDSLMAKN